MVLLKINFTGAASTMATEKLQDIPTMAIEDKLAGSIPGVQISSFQEHRELLHLYVFVEWAP